MERAAWWNGFLHRWRAAGRMVVIVVVIMVMRVRMIVGLAELREIDCAGGAAAILRLLGCVCIFHKQDLKP